MKGFPRLYHVTDETVATRILAHGFEGRWQRFTGQHASWFSNRPLDASTGPTGHTLLHVTFRVKLSQLAKFEISEEGKTYRERVIPATFIKKHAVVERGPNDYDVD